MKRWCARPTAFAEAAEETVLTQTDLSTTLLKTLAMSLNKVMLIGNVGQEPDVRYIDAGVPTATLNLATTTRGYTLQNGTQVPERTEWHRVVLFRRLAEVVEKYVHKGDKLYIEGELRTRQYNDKLGHARSITEVWANNLEMLSPKTQPAAPAVPEAPKPANDDDNLPF